MISAFSILWRLVLTIVTLLFLASCGIEQSSRDSSPPEAAPSVTSPPTASAPGPTALAAFTATPSPSPNTPLPTIAPTFAAPTVSANPTQPAKLTFTLADDGKTIALQVGDTFLLDLGANYVWQVTIVDPSIVNHVPNTGGKDNQGLYASFRQGSTTLNATGTPACYNAVPRCLMPSRIFSLHINVTGGVNTGSTITYSNNGQTIPLAVGKTFLLNLGQDLNWTVTVDDQNIVSRVPNITVPKGSQGVYEAKGPGTTTLHATGIAICPPGQACIQIALEFHVQLNVK